MSQAIWKAKKWFKKNLVCQKKDKTKQKVYHMERQLEKILVKFKGRFYVGPSQA